MDGGVRLDAKKDLRPLKKKKGAKLFPLKDAKGLYEQQKNELGMGEGSVLYTRRNLFLINNTIVVTIFLLILNCHNQKNCR